MDIRNRIRQVLNEENTEFRSDVPASEPVKGAPIRDPSLYSKKERNSTRDLIFKKLLSTDAYKEKIQEIGSLTDEEKLQFVKQLVQSKDILDKDPDEDYVEVLDDEISHRQQMNQQLLGRVNEAIKAYNGAIESHKNAFGAGLSTTYLTLPTIKTAEDFKGLKLFLANAPHIAQRFFPLMGMDLSSLKAEDIDDVGIQNKADALNGEVNRSNLPPRTKQQFLRRLNTLRRALSDGKSKIKTSGARVSVDDFLNMIQQDFKKASASMMMEGINAPNPEKAQGTIDRYFKWLMNGKNYQSLPFIINAIEEMVKALKAIEINNMVIDGFNTKKQKLLNLRSKGSLTPEAEELVILDPDDFPVGDTEPVDTLDEVKMMAESKEVPEDTTKQDPYKRQRKITRETKLKEIWRDHAKKIRESQVKNDNPDTGPDIHLGGMG